MVFAPDATPTAMAIVEQTNMTQQTFRPTRETADQIRELAQHWGYPGERHNSRVIERAIREVYAQEKIDMTQEIKVDETMIGEDATTIDAESVIAMMSEWGWNVSYGDSVDQIKDDAIAADFDADFERAINSL